MLLTVLPTAARDGALDVAQREREEHRAGEEEQAQPHEGPRVEDLTTEQRLARLGDKGDEDDRVKRMKDVSWYGIDGEREMLVLLLSFMIFPVLSLHFVLSCGMRWTMPV